MRALFILALLWSAAALGAAAQTIRVFVEHSGEDALGLQVASALRDEIRRSPAFELVFTEETSVYIVALSSLDPDEYGYSQQTRTALSVVYQMYNDEWFNYTISHNVWICGKSKIKGCAEDVARDLSVLNDAMLTGLAELASGSTN